MLGQKRQLFQNCRICTFPNSKKRNRNHEKLFNFWKLVILKVSTFHLNDKKNKRYRDFKTLKFYHRIIDFNQYFLALHMNWALLAVLAFWLKFTFYHIDILKVALSQVSKKLTEMLTKSDCFMWKEKGTYECHRRVFFNQSSINHLLVLNKPFTGRSCIS